MTDPIEIRPLAKGDRPVWEPLWRDYLTFYEVDRDAEVYDTTFARYCDPARDDMKAWLAWRGDEALGLVHVIVHAHGWQVAPVTYMQDLFTTAQARGTGVGRALIQTVYDDADAQGRPSVYWMTNRGNAVARQLYDRIATPTDFMKYARS